MRELRDRVAVVTGGAGGIGRGICRALADEGARVVVADIDGERAEAVAAELRGRGAIAEAVACDVTCGAAVDRLAATVRRRFGAVGLLCNNAGVAVHGDLHTISEADWDWVMAVNLKAIYFTVRAFVPRMLEAGAPAHIHNVASEHGVGLAALGRAPAYTASKHAVVGLSDVMRRDYGRHGIEVSVLCPGMVRTEIYDCARNRPIDRFGAGRRVAPDEGEPYFALAMDPDLAGRVAVDGIKAGDFFVITHPHVRKYAQTRHDQLMAACDDADRRPRPPNPRHRGN